MLARLLSKQPSYNHCRQRKMMQSLRKTGSFLSSIYLPQVLGIYPTEMKTYIHQNHCARLFVATLITESQNFGERTQISVNRNKLVWVNKLWYIHAMEYYGKRNNLYTQRHAEVSATFCWVTYFQKGTGCMTTFIGVFFKKSKINLWWEKSDQSLRKGGHTGIKFVKINWAVHLKVSSLYCMEIIPH